MNRHEIDETASACTMDYGSHNRERYLPSRSEASDQGRRAVYAIRRWLPSERDARILEIGCGPGNLLKGLEDAGYSCVRGIDHASELVRHGREVLAVDAVQGDWETEMRGAAAYDLIVALDVLEHLPASTVESVLAATRQRLSPNGRLVLRMPNTRCPYVLPLFHGDLTHQLLVDPDLLLHLLRKAGFDGSVEFAETRPHNRLKRAAFQVLHRLIVKPILSMLFFHFYQKLPGFVTANVYCCAFSREKW